MFTKSYTWGQWLLLNCVKQILPKQLKYVVHLYQFSKQILRNECYNIFVVNVTFLTIEGPSCFEGGASPPQFWSFALQLMVYVSIRSYSAYLLFENKLNTYTKVAHVMLITSCGKQFFVAIKETLRTASISDWQAFISFNFMEGPTQHNGKKQ